MMNKIIAAAVMTTIGLGTTAANAKVFNGFAVGANAGVAIAAGKIKDGPRFNKTYGIYGIQFDYHASKANSFYWGLGLDFNMYSGELKKSAIDDDGNTGIFKEKYRWSSEFDGRFGMNFCNKAIVYGLVGAKLYQKSHDLKVIIPGLGTAKSSKSEVSLVPVVGTGFQVALGEKMSAGVEYRVSFDQKTTYKIDGEKVASKKTQSHAILAKVSYHF